MTEQIVAEQEQGQEQSYIYSVKINALNGNVVPLELEASDSVLDARQMMQDMPSTCHYTNYHLEYDNMPISDYLSIAELAENVPSGSTLNMVADSYDDSSARFHVRRIREILVDPPMVTSTEEWMKNLKESNMDSTISESDSFSKAPESLDLAFTLKELEQFDELGSAKSDLPECVKSMVFSAWNPPPGNRRLQGDILYLEIETLEGQVYHITCSKKGFFVNISTSSKFSPLAAKNCFLSSDLVSLLSQVSPLFAERYAQLTGRALQMHPFSSLSPLVPIQHWCTSSSEHTADWNRSETSNLTMFGLDPKGAVRTWNEEFQSCVNLQGVEPDEQLFRLRTMHRVYSEFVQASIEGAKGVVEGNITPMNPADEAGAHVWCFNSIFFSKANDGRGMYKDLGGSDTTYKVAGHDLHGVEALDLLKIDGLHSVMTCIVDYCGDRIICQGVIPGILHSDQSSTLVYGALEDGTLIETNPEFYEKLGKFSDSLQLAERAALSNSGEVMQCRTAFETKGIIGSDRRFYILDHARIRPRDSNFPDKHLDIAKVLRPELLYTFVRDTAIERARKLLPKEDQAKKQPLITQEAYLEQAQQIKFNMNAFTVYEVEDEHLQADRELIQQAGDFLRDVVIPSFVLELGSMALFPMDGFSLRKLMHERGINMRYLGTVAKQISHLETIYQVFVRDMIVRSSKHILRRYLNDSGDECIASVVSMFLSGLLGANGFGAGLDQAQLEVALKMNIKSSDRFTSVNLWNVLRAEVSKRFQFVLDVDISSTMDSSNRLCILRELCTVCGVQLIISDFDFTKVSPFAVEDINDMVPTYKSAIPLGIDVEEIMKSGARHLSQGNIGAAQTVYLQALQILHQLVGPMHESSVSCYASLALIQFHQGNTIDALEHQNRALVICEKMFGRDHMLTAQHHGTFALYLQSTGNYLMALKHIRRCLYLLELIAGPNHPETVSALSNMAIVLNGLGKKQLSVECFEEALKRYEASIGSNHMHTAACLQNLAISHGMIEQFRTAMDYEKRSKSLYAAALGEEHYKVKECMKWLSHFTMSAVKLQAKQPLPVLESKAPFNWIPTGSMPRIPFRTQEDVDKINRVVEEMKREKIMAAANTASGLAKSGGAAKPLSKSQKKRLKQKMKKMKQTDSEN